MTMGRFSYVLVGSILLFMGCCNSFVVGPRTAVFSSKPKLATFVARDCDTRLEATREQPPQLNKNDVSKVDWTEGIKVASSVFFWLMSFFWIGMANDPSAWAADNGPRIVGGIEGSGLIFKDTLEIQAFEDPKVRGVTLYVSNFERPLAERLTRNFFEDPSAASVACVQTGPISVADNIVKGTAGEQVFDEKRSLFFKDLRVQRIYDEQKKTVVYVSFTTRLSKSDDTNKSRFKSSMCAINLDDSLRSPPLQSALTTTTLEKREASLLPQP